MTPEAIQAFIQLGFAAGVAAWLIYWLTGSLKRSIDVNTKSMLTVNLLILENQRFLLQHDAQVRGIDPGVTAEGDVGLKMAAQNYRQAYERLVTLEKVIQETLSGIIK